MSTKLLSGIKACAFDTYGTLFDFASAAAQFKAAAVTARLPGSPDREVRLLTELPPLPLSPEQHNVND